jgi:hypothetical protein
MLTQFSLGESNQALRYSGKIYRQNKVSERMNTLEGSCLCGSIKYEIAGPIIRFNLCHCDMCQKNHGAAFAPYLRVAKEHFSFTKGNEFISDFRSSADVCRTFCRVCGSNLQWIRDHADGMGVAAGTLDSKMEITPTAQLFCEDSKSWHQLRDDVPSFDTFPDS